MDQSGNAPHFRPTPQTANGKAPADPDVLPPSPARRAQLLFILIVLPVVAVTLPAIVVTSIFGQRPKVKPAAVSDVSGLNNALQQSATNLLPTPSALTGEPINLRCRPDRLAARTDRVKELAGAFGGTINEWLGLGEREAFLRRVAGRPRRSVSSKSGQRRPDGCPLLYSYSRVWRDCHASGEGSGGGLHPREQRGIRPGLPG